MGDGDPIPLSSEIGAERKTVNSIVSKTESLLRALKETGKFRTRTNHTFKVGDFNEGKQVNFYPDTHSPFISTSEQPRVSDPSRDNPRSQRMSPPKGKWIAIDLSKTTVSYDTDNIGHTRMSTLFMLDTTSEARDLYISTMGENNADLFFEKLLDWQKKPRDEQWKRASEGEAQELLSYISRVEPSDFLSGMQNVVTKARALHAISSPDYKDDFGSILDLSDYSDLLSREEIKQAFRGIARGIIHNYNMGRSTGRKFYDALRDRPDWNDILAEVRTENPSLALLMELPQKLPECFADTSNTKNVVIRINLDHLMDTWDSIIRTEDDLMVIRKIIDKESFLFERSVEIIVQHPEWSDADRARFVDDVIESDAVFKDIFPEDFSDRFHRLYPLIQNLERFIQIKGDFTDEGKLRGRDPFFVQYYLDTVFKHPEWSDADRAGFADSFIERWDAVVTTVPEFVPLIEPGGPLHSTRESFLDFFMQDEDFLRKAQQIVTIFTTDIPFWKQLYLFTTVKLGEQLKTATTNFPLDFGVSMRSPTGDSDVSFMDEFVWETTPIASMSVEQKRAMIDAQRGASLDDSAVGGLQEIPFSLLTESYKERVVMYFLSETIARSRSETVKEEADKRNRVQVRNVLEITPDMYIHGSAIDHLSSVLRHGNLSGETLGEKSATDAAPFQVDFVSVPQDFIRTQGEISKIIEETVAGDYGKAGSYFTDGQIFYLYDRSQTSWQPKRFSLFRSHHFGILVGMPSTETSAIVLRAPQITLEMAKKEVLENGFYIPIYDMNGRLRFTPRDYDDAIEYQNMRIPVEIWDYSLKVGDATGSNPGGLYVVPAADSDSKQHYVKFLLSENHVWNEQLADNLYKRAGYAVPKTKVVRVEGSYGHASEIVEADGTNEEAQLKDGFIMDAFLGNWDIVMERNVLSSGGNLYRIDNGGALLFRARGERKKRFGSTVIELETMRSSYFGLTSEDIARQMAEFGSMITDQVIDAEVDNTRMSRHERDELKRILKERRKFILEYDFIEAESEVPPQIPQVGLSVIGLLTADTIDDAVLTTFVPDEWSRFISEKGYQHNKILLGDHIKDVIVKVKTLPEFVALTEHEQQLAVLAALFHDFGKPTGRKDEQVERDFHHEFLSAQLAADYMMGWGFSLQDIKTVVRVILYDGVVTDIARGKVRDRRKNFTPEVLKTILGNQSTIRILRAVNKADGITTVGEQRFSTEASSNYDKFFDAMLS